MTEFSVFHNSKAARPGAYPFSDVVSVQSGKTARAEMARCPHYRPTPLVSLAGVARMAGVARVFYKDESARFGLGSFKALGGAYAVALLLAQRVAARTGHVVSVTDIARGRYRDITRDITVACATDGNHGRSVAAGAHVFGCKCKIFLHAGVSPGRAEAIANYGADIVRVAGNYDDSVHAVKSAAADHGWIIVSDTSWAGYVDTPALIMQGYTVMVAEVLEQLAAMGEALPTHVFLQGGVGGLAAAVAGYLWDKIGSANLPTIIVVEPQRADCLYQSARAGRPMPASGDLETVMAGLSCGEVSEVAWRILAASAAYFMTISDDAAVEGMRLLAAGAVASDARRDPPIIAGESATAGLGALLALTSDRATETEARIAPPLDNQARVLLIGTEGATDPVLYRQLVGTDARAVA